MFSVIIDKLVSMTVQEETAFQELFNNVLAKGKTYKSIAVIGENGIAFKFAETIRKAENNVLFVDADFSSSIFMNKYKLGKSLKGICDYLSGNELPKDLICSTNKENMGIVFTGDVDTYSILGSNEFAFSKLVELYKKDYDYVILEVGNDTDVAKYCDASLFVMDSINYSEKKAKKEVNRLTDEGCLILGVVLQNIHTV